jgi:hypothetical protein
VGGTSRFPPRTRPRIVACVSEEKKLRTLLRQGPPRGAANIWAAIERVDATAENVKRLRAQLAPAKRPKR